MKINIMKSFAPLLLLASTAKASESSLAFGEAAPLPKETKDNMLSASEIINKGRRLNAPPSAPLLESMMIKNLDCSACMESPTVTMDPERRLDNRELAAQKEVFVTARNCDAGDPYQIWELIPLDSRGTWYMFGNAEVEACMQLVGECSPNGGLYTIEMGECDPTNPKGMWGVTGLGQIVNFECFVNVYDSGSTPDVFLEAKCGPGGGLDKMDISSLSSGSEETAGNYWVVFPKDLFAEEETSAPDEAEEETPLTGTPAPTATEGSPLAP